MTKDAILTLSALDLAQAIREQKVTSEEAVTAVFEKIDERESVVHAYLSSYKKESLEQARLCDEKIREYYSHNDLDVESASTALPPLLGVPVAVKDNLLVEGKAATCGSRMLENFISPYTATCVEKLLDAGAILIGKTNMDEFGMGSSTEHSYFGVTRHPMDPDRVPGGSSGGSAAAMAYGGAFAALGTDTGGSIRQPAAFCGLVGLRPTYGSVSRHGLVAFASSMDIAGPITRGTRDAAGIFNIVTGADEKDQTSLSAPKIDLMAMEEYDITGKRIGIPKQLLCEGASVDPVEQARALYARYGAQIEVIDMPILDHCVAIYYILSSAEASSNLSRYDGIRYGFRAKEAITLSEQYTKTRSLGFGMEVKRRILLGNYVLSCEHFDDCYRQAERAREMVRKTFGKVFQDFDLLLCPVTNGEAPYLGKTDQDPLATYQADLYCVPASLAGIPAISVPCGTSESGLPMGIQLMAPRFGEQELLGAARFLEKQLRNMRFDSDKREEEVEL